VDPVCHGYFSPLFLRKEREYYEKKRGSRAIGYEFRNKDGGHWRDFKAVWRFEDGGTMEMPKSTLPYLRIWMDHLISRSSCHSCRFAFADRLSDLSLADYWHISKESQLYNGNKGTSAVFVNTQKGRDIIARLFASGDYELGPADRPKLCSEKTALHGPPTPHPLREKALDDLLRMSYQRYVKKWMKQNKPSLLHRIRGKIVKIVKRVMRRGA
jgi:coenzyme F420-reducing hydrogenase beta subunit